MNTLLWNIHVLNSPNVKDGNGRNLVTLNSLNHIPFFVSPEEFLKSQSKFHILKSKGFHLHGF